MKILDTAIQKITYKIIHTLLTSDFCASTSSSLSHDRKILPIPTAKSDAGSVFEALQKQCAAKRNKFNTYFIRRHFDQKNKFSPTFFIGDQLLLPLARCYMPIELFDSNQQFSRLAHSNFFFCFQYTISIDRIDSVCGSTQQYVCYRGKKQPRSILRNQGIFKPNFIKK